MPLCPRQWYSSWITRPRSPRLRIVIFFKTVFSVALSRTYIYKMRCLRRNTATISSSVPRQITGRWMPPGIRRPAPCRKPHDARHRERGEGPVKFVYLNFTGHYTSDEWTVCCVQQKTTGHRIPHSCPASSVRLSLSGCGTPDRGPDCSPVRVKTLYLPLTCPKQGEWNGW